MSPGGCRKNDHRGDDSLSNGGSRRTNSTTAGRPVSRSDLSNAVRRSRPRFAVLHKERLSVSRGTVASEDDEVDCQQRAAETERNDDRHQVAERADRQPERADTGRVFRTVSSDESRLVKKEEKRA